MIRLKWLSAQLAGAIVALSTASVGGSPEAPGPGATRSSSKHPADGRPITATPCSQGTRAALAEVACELSHALSGAASSGVVISAPLHSDQTLSSPDALSERLVRVVAGKLGYSAVRHPMAFGAASGLARSAGVLLYLQPRVEQGVFSVSADLYEIPRAFWDRVAGAALNPREHAFITRRLDAELRSFFPPVPLVVSELDKATLADRTVQALACGDIDGDGVLELVTVGRHRVAVGHARDGRFVQRAERRWRELSGIAPVPLREPLAAATIHQGRYVDVGITDRASGVRLDVALNPLAAFPERIPWPGLGCSARRGFAVLDQAQPCVDEPAQRGAPKTSGAPRPSTTAAESLADALAGVTLVGRDGVARSVRAWRAFNTSNVIVRDERAAEVQVPNSGAELALGDLNGNGTAELVTSLDTLNAADDALIVYGRRGNAFHEHIRLSVPTGIRAIAICPWEGRGMSRIVVATAGELWFIR